MHSTMYGAQSVGQVGWLAGWLAGLGKQSCLGAFKQWKPGCLRDLLAGVVLLPPACVNSWVLPPLQLLQTPLPGYVPQGNGHPPAMYADQEQQELQQYQQQEEAVVAPQGGFGAQQSLASRFEAAEQQQQQTEQEALPVGEVWTEEPPPHQQDSWDRGPAAPEHLTEEEAPVADGWGSLDESAWEPLAEAPPQQQASPEVAVPAEEEVAAPAADGWGDDGLGDLLPPAQQQQWEEPAFGATEDAAAAAAGDSAELLQLQQQVALLSAQLEEQAALAAAKEQQLAALQRQLEEQAAATEQRQMLGAAAEHEGLKQVGGACAWWHICLVAHMPGGTYA